MCVLPLYWHEQLVVYDDYQLKPITSVHKDENDIEYIVQYTTTDILQKRTISNSPTVKKKTEVVEGSGNDSRSNLATSHPDMEIHGSGYGNDDEDGDSETIQGSGVPSDIVEGSGGIVVAHMITRPQLTTTTTTKTPPISYATSTTTQVCNFKYINYIYV
uniref:ATS domain-containing protein n=1 Tax=Heterorhabditis bacteriophora TaxID=37862 RepID=A0A1I7XGL9_HETBA